MRKKLIPSVILEIIGTVGVVFLAISGYELVKHNNLGSTAAIGFILLAVSAILKPERR